MLLVELRLWEKLNQRFIPNNHLGIVSTPQDAKAWRTIERNLISLAKSSTTPKQLWVSISFAESTPLVTLSNCEQMEVDLTLQGVKNIIPKAENQGLKVQYNALNKEYFFTLSVILSSNPTNFIISLI